MKTIPVREWDAFTLIELIVILFVLSIIFSVAAYLYGPNQLRYARAESCRIFCILSLKEIGRAYREFENDHGDRYPASVPMNQGGWSDILSNPDQGSLCWTNYATMEIYLGRKNQYGDGNFPKRLVCPSDIREPVTAFSNFVSNIKLSYFVGLTVTNNFSQLIGGDRNLGDGKTPKSDYGFSPNNGQGNDVAIQTNPVTGPINWSIGKMHSFRTNGGGNFLLDDGSVQQSSGRRLGLDFQPHFEPTTNWPAGHAPSYPSIRVLFP